MELCTSRHLLLSTFIIQLVIVSCRQVFDFLGYMWASVLANFVYTLFLIFGIFGVVQSKSKYTISYVISSFYWLCWNLFIMCIYLDILNLRKFKNILSFQTNSSSWWETNGPGCKVFLSNLTLTEDDPYQGITPDMVTGCIFDSQYLEGIQAAIQVVFATCGFIIGIKVSHEFMSKNDCNDTTKKSNNGLPLYSIEYNPRRTEEYDDEEDDNSSQSHADSDNRCTTTSGNRPMTPRRVKRRSVNSKNTHSAVYQPRQEQQPPPYNMRKSLAYGSARSSGRSSTRRQRPTSNNPISKYLERQQQFSFQQQMLNDSSTSNDSCRMPYTSSQSQLLSASELMQQTPKIGHDNPNFTSSTSLDRPPSARSSYSNYHGVRTMAFNKQATPQVPSNSIRRNWRPTYSTFFNDGPPAYEIQGVVNSETVI